MPATDYSQPVERLVPAELAGLRFDQALARMFPQHSRSRLQAWVREGRVLLDARRADAKRKVWGGERVHVAPPEAAAAAAPAAEPIALEIVHEDGALLVVDKPAGLVVHPGAGNARGTLLNALLHRCPALADLPRAGIVHRLDKDTSGLLVVAKTLDAHTALVRKLAARTVKREYVALVHGAVERDGEVVAPIGRHPSVRTRMAVVAGGRPARTVYRVVERFPTATRLAVTLDTGRTHQIRVHMRSIGHPLLGDPAYGRGEGDPALRSLLRRQALHAARLALEHPATGERCEWTSPLPRDLLAAIDSLRARRTMPRAKATAGRA